MSTSDPGRDSGRLELAQDPAGFGALPGIAEFAPVGLLDPARLAILANEFFTALPGAQAAPLPDLSQQTSPAASAVDAASLGALASVPVTPPAAPPEVSLPSDQHFPGVPASAGPASVSPASATVQAAPSVIPGALAGSIPTQAQAVPPAFSFLQDARPIAGDSSAIPSPAYPPAQPIAEFVQPGLPAETAVPGFDSEPEAQALRFQVPQIQVPQLFDPPFPALPGLLGKLDSAPVPAFSFLEEARPLFSSSPSVPGPVPSPVPAVPAEPAQWNDLPSFAFLDGVRTITSADAPKTPDASTIGPNVPLDLALSSHAFDAEALKRDFPILRERVNGRSLVWLDNAATTQKPQTVIDRLKYFYEHENSNVHRAAHELAARATDAYESAREKVRRFLNASSTREIIFVRGATEGINLVARAWGWQNIQKDDEIVITWLEHHANIVPWQVLAAEKGAKLRVAPVDDTGQILLDEYEKLLGPRTRLVALPQVSNALGVVTPAAEMIEAAHRYGAKVLLDGAQSVSHMCVDVQSLDCDFFVFSGHKVFAPTGIGVVYGKPELLEHMQPWQGGGNMIQDVTFERTLYQPPPQRFEAGTGNIADAVGLGAAIDYLDRAGMANISRHEHNLLVYATAALEQIPGLRIIGTAREKAGVLSFVMEGFRTEEIGDYLNRNGIAVRSGHHCAQPILRRFGLESTVRASLALYNTFEDIDALVTALWNLRLGHTSIA
jgi:cysteine desulfurase / selenocysteine lyase